MSDAPAKTEEAAEGEKPKKKNKKVIFIALGVVLLIAGAGVPMFLMGGEPEEGAVEEHAEEEHHPEKHLETADLGTLVVNLSEATSFLKAHILVEFDNVIVEKQMKPPAEGEEHAAEEGGGEHGGGEKGGGAAPLPEFMAKREVQIKDTLLRVLSSKKAEDVLTPEGKERLKEELIEGLNEAVALEEPPLTAVYFTEFIIQ
jgi:flagellar FliL protein